MVIQFEANTPYGVYRDSITLPAFHTLTDQEIEAIKQSRINDFIQSSQGASEEPAPEIIEIDGKLYQALGD